MKGRRHRSLSSVVAAALLLVLFCLPQSAYPEESVFGLQLLGTSDESGDARARGLGVFGVALDDTTTAATLNPAAHGSLQYMTLSLVTVTGSRSVRSDETEAREGFARFPQIRAALPIFGRLTLGTGFMSFANTRGRFRLEAREIDGLPYGQRFERDGSLYTIPVVLAAPIGRFLRLGVSADFLLGKIDEKWITEGDSILSLASRRQDEMSGTTMTLGAIVVPKPWMRLGISWSPAFDVQVKRTLSVENTTPGSSPLRVTTTESTSRFPQVLRLGATVQVKRDWLLTADYHWRAWEDYEGSLYEAEGVGNETRLGGGLEWKASLYTSCRLGLSRRTWAQEVGGESLRETALHFGAGVPMTPGMGGLHVALEYAWIGQVESNRYEERVWRVVVSLSGQERWIRKGPGTR